MKTKLFQLIDLDRTLFDTARFVKALIDEIELTEPGFGVHLSEQFHQSYKNEETFFLLRYLRQERGDEWFGELVQGVAQKHDRNSFVMPGVVERLELAEVVTSYRPAWGILTYGDEIDQRMKAALIGLGHVPIYLVDSPDKSEIIQSWVLPDGTFQLPIVFGGGIVDKITLEDDKLRAFKSLPQHATGIWVNHAAYDGILPHDVTKVESLEESSRYLMRRYLSK